MTMEQNTAMAEVKAFPFPVLEQSSGFSAEEMATDFEGLAFSFPRIKIPSGETAVFTLPTDHPDKPEHSSTLVGVLVGHHQNYAYWREGEEYNDDKVPQCVSYDGMTGYGCPGGLCSTCALNQYGSAEKSEGKACKNMRAIYLLREGDSMPTQILLPPTSLKSFSEFMNFAFRMKNRRPCGSVISIGLKSVMNTAINKAYCIATFDVLYHLEGENLRDAIAYANATKLFLDETNKSKIEEAALRSNASGEAGIYSDYTTGALVTPIDGDSQALPM